MKKTIKNNKKIDELEEINNILIGSFTNNQLKYLINRCEWTLELREYVKNKKK